MFKDCLVSNNYTMLLELICIDGESQKEKEHVT